jgi:protein-tyrosine phosphatase
MLQAKRVDEGVQSQDPTSRWWRETDFEVLLRNRYMNVQPWANHRIHLHVPEGHSDYINASPITLKSLKDDKECKYIATQVS